MACLRLEASRFQGCDFHAGHVRQGFTVPPSLATSVSANAACIKERATVVVSALSAGSAAGMAFAGISTNRVISHRRVHVGSSCEKSNTKCCDEMTALFGWLAPPAKQDGQCQTCMHACIPTLKIMSSYEYRCIQTRVRANRDTCPPTSQPTSTYQPTNQPTCLPSFGTTIIYLPTYLPTRPSIHPPLVDPSIRASMHACSFLKNYASNYIFRQPNGLRGHSGCSTENGSRAPWLRAFTGAAEVKQKTNPTVIKHQKIRNTDPKPKADVA